MAQEIRGAQVIFLTQRESCPVCSEIETEVLYGRAFDSAALRSFLNDYYSGRLKQSWLDGKPFQIERCTGCSLIFQRWVPTPEGLGVLYSELIDSQESLAKRVRAGHSYYQRLSESVGIISSLYPDAVPSDLRVMDFGMGWGHWVQAAMARGFTCVGVELSVERRLWAAERGVCSIPDIPSSGHERFDFINADQVFEHLTEPLDVLKKLSSVLAPGGYIKIAVPNPRDELRAIRARRWSVRKGAFHPLEHVNAFTPNSLTRMAAMAGLRPLAFSDAPADFSLFSLGAGRQLLRRPSGLFQKQTW